MVIEIITASSVQTLGNGDMALLDMGAEYHFYGSDITCSFPVSSYICVCNWPFTLLVEYLNETYLTLDWLQHRASI